MIDVIPCRDHLDELVRFIARLNNEGPHHIGYLGEDEADNRSVLSESLIPAAEGFRLAYEGSRLVGVLGVDADPEINRAWLFGPIVEHADWHTIADQLYAEVLPLIPVDIREYELFCDVQNIHIEGFAARHGFPLISENAVMTLERGSYRPAAGRQAEVTAYREDLHEQFEGLHRMLFPSAYLTARQMVEKRDTSHRLLLALENGALLGFIFCKIDPVSKSGYVDFVGTDPSARGRGIGADLLAAGLEWMLSAPATSKVNLTVNADDEAALRLYGRFGFVTERIMRGYRKRIA